MLCKDCEFWKPNGGKTSIGAVYNDSALSSKLGNCTKYNVLKNELNTCKEMENMYKNDTEGQ